MISWEFKIKGPNVVLPPPSAPPGESGRTGVLQEMWGSEDETTVLHAATSLLLSKEP